MIADLTPYAEYKESGIPWLGSVPGHWDVRRLRASITDCVNGVWGADPNGKDDLTCVRVADFDRVTLRVSLRKKTIRAIPFSARSRRLLQRGDLLLEKSGGGDLQPVGAVVAYDHDEPAVCSNFVARMPMASGYDTFFVNYLHLTLYANRVNLRSIKQTTGIQNLDGKAYLSEPVAFPPPAEQAAIVRFLDWANGRLERAIRAKRKVIVLLNEQKQAIIHRAVTRGLDPSVPLKPSGIPWLGDIPRHWEVLALKRVLRRLLDCEHKTAPHVEESAFRVVRTTGVRHGALRIRGTYCTSSDAFHAWTRRGLPEPGDVVFTREAPAGEACIVPEDMNVCLGQRTVLMKPNKRRLDPQFLVHMIYAGPPRISITLASQGSTVGHFNMADIGSLTILLPPRQEQDEIVAAVVEQTAGLDIAMSRLEREIELLREYRTRLVADVVTGKLDVREAAAGLPDEAAPNTVEDDAELSDEPEPADEDAVA